MLKTDLSLCGAYLLDSRKFVSGGFGVLDGLAGLRLENFRTLKHGGSSGTGMSQWLIRYILATVSLERVVMKGIDDTTLAERRRCAAAVADMQNQRQAYRVITGDMQAQLPKKHWVLDVIDAHIQRGLSHEAALTNVFTEWFQVSGCDFWSECNAPEELAAVAIEYFSRLRKQ